MTQNVEAMSMITQMHGNVDIVSKTSLVWACVSIFGALMLCRPCASPLASQKGFHWDCGTILVHV